MNDFNDRPLSTRVAYGPYYGRANNQIEPNRAMLEVSFLFFNKKIESEVWKGKIQIFILALDNPFCWII